MKDGMILIKEIETVTIDRDPCEIFATNMPDDYFPVNGGDVMERVEVISELVRGRRFTNQHGETVVIGMSKRVQDLLGMQFEAWDTLQEELQFSNQTVSRMRSELQAIKKNVNEASWHERVKWLFKGIKC